MVLGRAASTLAVITLLRLGTGGQVDRIVCYLPQISTDRELLAFVKWYPPHPGYGVTLSDEYLAYDLTRPPSYNRTPGNRARRPGPYNVGWPLYPPGARNAPLDNVTLGTGVPPHTMASSRLFWLGNRVVSFADRWHGVVSLVVANLSDGVQHPRVTVRSLDTSRIVDLRGCKARVAPSDFKRWSKDPAILVYVTDIQSSKGSRDTAQLRLAPQECVTKTTVDIALGQPAQAAAQ